jgi:exopolysaccharide biosynthesis polyprenyl glycosylphosphotransferase
MSEQTATSGYPAGAPRGLELAPPRPVPARRSSTALITAVRVTIDVASLATAAIVVGAWSSRSLSPVLVVLVGLGIILGLTLTGAYVPRGRVRPLVDIRQVLTITAALTMAAAATELALGETGVGDAAVRFWLLTATLMVSSRVALQGAEQLSRRSARGEGATLIVGAGRVGHLAARRLLDDPALGLRPVGFLDKEPLGDVADEAGASGALPVLGASWDLEAVVRSHDIENVLVAFSTAPNHVVLDVVRRCWRLGVNVMVVPRLYEVEGVRAHTEHLGALPLVTLSPSDPSGWMFTAKYAVDRLVALLTLILTAPLIAGITLAILITSGRPIFFRQRRVGRDGHVFEMLKFRTMSGAPEASGEFDAEWAALAASGARIGDAEALVGEDRRTPMGTFLRRTSIDELPQLWNVFRGDMSLIGPRPERLHYVELFERSIYRYPDRHRVKSGLTGWAQVNGLRGNTSLADRIEWDNFYIENWSPWLDLKILVKTIPALLAGRGAR